MPFTTTQDEFVAIFQGSGARDARITVNSAGHSCGYGLVQFGSVDAAAAAIATFDGYPINAPGGPRAMKCKFDSRPDDRPRATKPLPMHRWNA